MNLAKKSLKKLKLLNALELGPEDFDRDDLIMIIHTFSWSALEGFANFLLNVVGFRNNICGLYLCDKYDEYFLNQNTQVNALVVIDSQNNVYHQSRINITSHDPVKKISEAEREELLKAILGETNPSKLKKNALVKGNLESADLRAIKSKTGITHTKIEHFDHVMPPIKTGPPSF